MFNKPRPKVIMVHRCGYATFIRVANIAKLEAVGNKCKIIAEDQFRDGRLVTEIPETDESFAEILAKLEGFTYFRNKYGHLTRKQEPK